MKVQIMCRCLASGNWMGMKGRKKSIEKTEELQISDWNDKKFDRE